MHKNLLPYIPPTPENIRTAQSYRGYHPESLGFEWIFNHYTSDDQELIKELRSDYDYVRGEPRSETIDPETLMSQGMVGIYRKPKSDQVP